MEYNVLSDAELVALAQKNDNVAMDAIIERYKNFVRGKGRTYFLIGADKEDIIQEGMIGLFKPFAILIPIHMRNSARLPSFA